MKQQLYYRHWCHVYNSPITSNGHFRFNQFVDLEEADMDTAEMLVEEVEHGHAECYCIEVIVIK